VSSTSSTEPIVPESDYCDDIATFVTWAVAQIGSDLSFEDGIGRLKLDSADQASFDGRSELRLAVQDFDSSGELESIDLDSRFGRWLINRLRSCGPAVHSRPREQPTSVKDIAASLFSAYTVEGGQLHLGGCQLVDYPFLRLSYASEDKGQTSVKHLFVAHDGSSATDQQIQELGLLDTEPITKSPPRIEDATLDTLIAAGRRIGAKATTVRNPAVVTVEPLMATLVWIKHVSGQLEFEIGNSTECLSFSGWAKLIQPQPFVARHSGTATYRLAATDDGRIDAYDQIAICQQSGQRVLKQDLVECQVTGKQVLRAHTTVCPVSGEPALLDQFSGCLHCQQQVSKASLQDGLCGACRDLKKIKKDDPRLVWILGEHPGLDRWNRWQLAETQHVYIAQAHSLTRCLLVVVDKESLEVRHLSTGSRLSSSWTPIPGPAQSEYLN